MEPVGVMEEGLVAVGGKYQIFVLDGFDDLLLGLLLQQLLLCVDVDDE